MKAARLGAELPRQLRRLVSQIEQGHIEVGVRPSSFEPLVRRQRETTARQASTDRSLARSVVARAIRSHRLRRAVGLHWLNRTGPPERPGPPPGPDRVAACRAGSAAVREPVAVRLLGPDRVPRSSAPGGAPRAQMA